MTHVPCPPLALDDVKVGDFIETVSNRDHIGFRGKVTSIDSYPNMTFISFTDLDASDGRSISMGPISMGLIEPDPCDTDRWTTYRINEGPEDAKFGANWGPRKNLPRIIENPPDPKEV